MSQNTMYNAINNSPITTLVTDITASDRDIDVVDTYAFPAAPNIATIGDDEEAELVLYAGKTGTTLTNCTRGFNGTTPQSFEAGTKVYRAFTAYDHNTFIANIRDLVNRVQSTDAKTAEAVKYTEAQTLTEAQKVQSRTNIGAASEGDLSDVKSAINNLESGIVNIPVAYVQNRYVDNTTGNIIPYNGWYASERFEVIPGEEIYIVNSTNTIYNAFYKSDGTFLSGFSCPAGNPSTVTVPENARFAAISNVANAFGTVYRFTKFMSGITAANDKVDSIAVSVEKNYDEFENAVFSNDKTVLLPHVGGGYAKAVDYVNPIYTGGYNIAALFGFPSGEKSVSGNGITAIFNKNHIIVSGTATANCYLSFNTQTIYTDASTMRGDGQLYTLPNYTQYYFKGFWIRGTESLSIQNISSDNIITRTPANAESTLMTATNDWGHVYVYVPNGTTVDLELYVGLFTEYFNSTFRADTSTNVKIISDDSIRSLGELTWGATNQQILLVYNHAKQLDFVGDGKKIAWFGDSISQLKELPNIVGDYLQTTVYDCTFAGAPLTYGDATLYQPTGFMSLCTQIVAGDFSDLSDALDAQEAQSINVTEKRAHLATLQAIDFNSVTDIVVFAGTNDFDNDYVNATNFVSGFSGALTTLLTAYPHLMVYVFSPIWRGDKTEGVETIPTMPDLIDLEKDVADAFSLPFYDLYHRSGINEYTASVYLQNDLLHPSDAGDSLLANKCAKFIQSN